MKRKIRKLSLKLALLFLKLSKHPLYIVWSLPRHVQQNFPVWGIYTNSNKADKVRFNIKASSSFLSPHLSVIEINEDIFDEMKGIYD
jgi:hypothetical protein